MRVVVLGGAGIEGRSAVEDLVRSGVSEINVADRNLEKARTVAEQYKDSKSTVSAQYFDADSHAGLVKAMEGADVAASAVGPFYKYGPKVLKAAIEAGVNFVDINDDYDGTKKELELGKQAERAGITAIVGLGEAPGLTNLVAKYGADKLDEVDEIHIKWVCGFLDATGQAATSHWFHCITGMVPTYVNGQWVNVPARSEPEIVNFPQPLGNVEVYNVGHPEPVTLPRYIKGIKTVTNKGGIAPIWANRAFNTLAELGFTSTELLHVKDASIKPRDFSVALIRAIRYFAPETLQKMSKENGTELTGMIVEVKGKKDGEIADCIYTWTGQMGPWTSIPLSIAAQMLARGDIKVKGVFAPEGCVDPKIFLGEVLDRKLNITETEEKIRRLSIQTARGAR